MRRRERAELTMRLAQEGATRIAQQLALRLADAMRSSCGKAQLGEALWTVETIKLVGQLQALRSVLLREDDPLTGVPH